MAAIDRDLVRAINSGRCFALIGAGPSCEIGLPSWSKLAEGAIALVDAASHAAVIDHCHNLLAAGDYPAVFSQIRDVIGTNPLLEYIKCSLPQRPGNGAVYSYLARWPFAVYLTTNYDDCLSESLQIASISYPVKHNSHTDFLTLRADSRGVIYKIHGDCTTPDDIVLTSEQYDAFRTSDDRNYWREKIRSIMHMVSVVLVGYSASDPNFTDQLKRAKDLASPAHPIFMFATGVPIDDIRRYFLKYNIRIIPYRNPDGTHRELQRVLRRYDPFVAKRGTPHIGQEPLAPKRADLASSLHLFTQLNLSGVNDTCLKKSYEALIASGLGEYADGETVHFSELQTALASKLGIQHLDPHTLQAALESLHCRGYIDFDKDQGHCFLKASGRDKLEETKAERALRQEKFAGACRLFLRREHPRLASSAQDEVIQQLQEGLVRAFEKRGLEMAQATFGQDTIDLSTATDILEVVNRQSSNINGDDARAACADLMLEVLLHPTQEMKERIADLSQGYFSYHALGLDPTCGDERLRMARGRAWILDSSIILPALAKDCGNHEFAQDLLTKMKAQKFRLVTTGRLFVEVSDHALWAIRNFKDATVNSPDLLQAASVGPGYKQNLFIDGYVKWAASQGAPSLESYFREILGKEFESETGDCVKEKVAELGIEVVEFCEWPEFDQEQWGDRKGLEDKIVEMRRARGTYRSDEQCRAEAEVLVLCEKRKAAFLSQSGVLDSIEVNAPCITWKPESMYRFLSTFSSAPSSVDLLYQSMVQDFYYSGFDIVNYDALEHYFAGPVKQSRMNLDEERSRYEEALGMSEYRKLRSEYENVPDLQKPFYSMQFAFLTARKEIEKRNAAEVRARKAEKSKTLTAEERRQFERLKAEEAEKKRQAKRKQRRQQSQKKRGKKKKK